MAGADLRLGSVYSNSASGSPVFYLPALAGAYLCGQRISLRIHQTAADYQPAFEAGISRFVAIRMRLENFRGQLSLKSAPIVFAGTPRTF